MNPYRKAHKDEDVTEKKPTTVDWIRKLVCNLIGHNHEKIKLIVFKDASCYVCGAQQTHTRTARICSRCGIVVTLQPYSHDKCWEHMPGGMLDL